MIAKWIFKQFIQLQIFMYRRSGGKRMGTLRGMPLLLLTTVGRKTGMERVTPLMYIRDGENYVITASNNGGATHPAWFANIKANPQARIQVGDINGGVTARQASAEEKARLWAVLVERAPFFESYKQRTTRDIPMVILQPTGVMRKAP
jgi:deazaflavin-dependent oxidoreductase (nitroreductase family)